VYALIALILFVVPAAAQPLSFPGLQGDSGISLGNDPEALIRDDLAGARTELQGRLETQQAQLRWRLERLEGRRKDNAVAERGFDADRGSRSNRRLREEYDALLTETQAIDSVLVNLQERYDEELELLFEGGALIRQLSRELDTDLTGEVTLRDVAEAELDKLGASLATQRRLSQELSDLIKSAEVGLAEHRAAYEAARLQVYRDELPAIEVDDPMLGGHPGFEVPGIEIIEKPLSKTEEAKAGLRATGRQLALRKLELQVALDRQTRDLLELKQEMAQLPIAVLERRIKRWESRVAELRTREAGGVLAVGRVLIPADARTVALAHTRSLLASPDAALLGVSRRMEETRPDSAGRAVLFAILLLGVLVAVLGRRLRPRLEAWQPEGRLDDLIRAGVVPALPLLPLTAVCGSLAYLQMVPGTLLPLYRFSAVGPPLAAAVIGLAGELFPVGGGSGLSPQLARYYRGLIRLLAGLALLLSLVIDLLPTLQYPAEAEDLVRAVLAGVLLLGWLAVALRKDEILSIVGIREDAPQGPLQAGVARFYRVIALGPVALWFLDAIGYENLARLLARGGLVALCVALLAPWFHARLRTALEAVLGYPDGGGLLALTPDGSTAAYRALAPVLLVGVGGVSALLMASGWDYQDNLIDNLVGSATYTLVHLGGSEVTAASLGLLTLTAAATLLATRWINGVLDRHVYPLYDLDRATRATMAALVRYSGWGIGTLVGLKVVGFGAAVLGVVGSVIGIGVGFGSQTIAANFIAGLMLLLTRRISVDDVIEVDGLVGRVLRITSYSTVVRTLDNLQVIVPNAQLIDSQVVNWTVDDDKIRLHVPVGVAYGSDVPLVKKLMLQACAAEPNVLGWPRAAVRFDDFADSALVFTILPWIENPDDRYVVASELRFAVDVLFREHGIEIAFPQTDVHLRDGVLRVAMEPAPEAPPPPAEPAEG